MPAWEDRLGEDDIWKVIMYLYDATGYQPRRWETQASLFPPPPRADDHGDRRGRGWWTAAQAEAQQAGDAASGKAVYERKCSLCHGPDGKGDGPGAPTLDP